jgi:hypothetical protein
MQMAEMQMQEMQMHQRWQQVSLRYPEEHWQQA